MKHKIETYYYYFTMTEYYCTFIRANGKYEGERIQYS